MAEAVIVEAVRSPVGKRNGGLSGVHAADLSAQVLNGLVERAGIDPALVDDVIWGCVSQAGEQAIDIHAAAADQEVRGREVLELAVVAVFGAARDLADMGATVRIVEARDRVGGRIWTQHLSDGSPIDRGPSM